MSVKKNSAKEHIKQAFCELLLVKPYQDVTVTDVVKQAGVARVTFYRVYGSVDMLLDDVIHDCYAVCERDLLAHLVEGDYDALLPLLDQLMIALKQNKMNILRLLNTAVVVGKLESMLIANAPAAYRTGPNRYHIVSQCGVILSILHTWSAYGFDDDPEYLARYIVAVLKQVNAKESFGLKKVD